MSAGNLTHSRQTMTPQPQRPKSRSGDNPLVASLKQREMHPMGQRQADLSPRAQSPLMISPSVQDARVHKAQSKELPSSLKSWTSRDVLETESFKRRSIMRRQAAPMPVIDLSQMLTNFGGDAALTEMALLRYDPSIIARLEDPLANGNFADLSRLAHQVEKAFRTCLCFARCPYVSGWGAAACAPHEIEPMSPPRIVPLRVSPHSRDRPTQRVAPSTRSR